MNISSICVLLSLAISHIFFLWYKRSSLRGESLILKFVRKLLYFCKCLTSGKCDSKSCETRVTIFFSSHNSQELKILSKTKQYWIRYVKKLPVWLQCLLMVLSCITFFTEIYFPEKFENKFSKMTSNRYVNTFDNK